MQQLLCDIRNVWQRNGEGRRELMAPVALINAVDAAAADGVIYNCITSNNCDTSSHMQPQFVFCGDFCPTRNTFTHLHNVTKTILHYQLRAEYNNTGCH